MSILLTRSFAELETFFDHLYFLWRWKGLGFFGLGCRVCGLRFVDWSLRFGTQGLGVRWSPNRVGRIGMTRPKGLGFGVWGLGIKVWG